jgi:hypothetical protein
MRTSPSALHIVGTADAHKINLAFLDDSIKCDPQSAETESDSTKEFQERDTILRIID